MSAASTISHTNHLLRGHEQRAPGCTRDRVYLARHAYVERLEGVLIILDLRGDSYLRVERPFSHILGIRLGLPPEPIDVSEPLEFSEEDAVAALPLGLHCIDAPTLNIDVCLPLRGSVSQQAAVAQLAGKSKKLVTAVRTSGALPHSLR